MKRKVPFDEEDDRHSLQSKIDDLQRRLEKSREETFNAEKKYRDLTEKLRKDLECPVCLDVPTSGPLPECPNGHFVCTDCKVDGMECPSCRTPMDNGQSLISRTIIENIEHKCGFDGCGKMVAHSYLGNHMKNLCLFRPVSCPASKQWCKSTIPFNTLEHHLLSECNGSANKRTDGQLKRADKNDTLLQNYRGDNSKVFSNSFSGSLWTCKNESFFVRNEVQNEDAIFTVFHLSNPSEKKLKAGFLFHKYDDINLEEEKIEFTIPVHRLENEKKSFVRISNEMMQMVTKKDDKDKYTLTMKLKIQEKLITHDLTL